MNQNPNPNPPNPPPSEPPAPPPVVPPAPPSEPPAAPPSSPPPGSTPPPGEVNYQLKVPDGSLLKPEHVAALTEFAKANKVAPEIAQAILERDSNAVASLRKAQEDANTQEAEGWRQTTLKDPEIGGTPEKVEASAHLAHRVFQQFGTPELGKLFASTKIGNHPELVRLAVRISKAIGNDTFVNPPSKFGPQTRQTDAELFYPKKTQAK